MRKVPELWAALDELRLTGVALRGPSSPASSKACVTCTLQSRAHLWGLVRRRPHSGGGTPSSSPHTLLRQQQPVGWFWPALRGLPHLPREERGSGDGPSVGGSTCRAPLGDSSRWHLVSRLEWRGPQCRAARPQAPAFPIPWPCSWALAPPASAPEMVPGGKLWSAPHGWSLAGPRRTRLRAGPRNLPEVSRSCCLAAGRL